MVAMPKHPNRVALIHDHVAGIWDWKKKFFTRFLPHWTGMCSTDGRYGIYAPTRGGLEMIELKAGSTVHVLIPRVALGVFNNRAMFTTNDKHIVYYNSGHRTIKVQSDIIGPITKNKHNIYITIGQPYALSNINCYCSL